MFYRTSNRRASRGIATFIFLIVAGFACVAYAHLYIQKGPEMPNHAAGTFDVKLTPQTEGTDATLGRMTIDKQYHGDLEGTSKGQMLTGMTETKGSAAYVAIEKVTGTLRGRAGTFILQHMGTMNRGVPHLTVTVVPDSGTGELTGLNISNFILKIDEGKHSYDFEYTLPESH
jgi:Protein of unknown function (DUF3224)